MSRIVATTLFAAVLIMASSIETLAARGRSKVVRGRARPAPGTLVTPPVNTSGAHDLLHRQGGGTVHRGVRPAPHPHPVASQHAGASRASSASIRDHAWAYAGRLRRTGQRIWAAMFGMSVSLGMFGGEVGKQLSGEEFDSVLDTLTSPHVLVAGFIPTFAAILLGRIVRDRYVARAEAIEASVRENYNAELGTPAQP